MGLFMDGSLRGNKNSNQVVDNKYKTILQSIWKVEIDMFKKWISWYFNDSLVYTTKIWS
jgi:hypothetical protein